MKNIIDLLRLKIGIWLIFPKNKTLTATAIALQEEAKNRKCDHCGLNPIHFLEDCDCSKFHNRMANS